MNIACYTTKRIFLRLETRRHVMNYGLGENLILNTLRPLAMSVTYSGVGRILESLMLNLM